VSHEPALPDILAQITDAVRERLAREREPAGLQRRAREAAGVRRRGGRRSLLEALRAPGVRVIAECKRRSPSAGLLRQPFDPLALARAYEGGGAAAISVVTEPKFFSGEAGWVPAVRQAVALPVLQKDFLLSQRQLAEAAVLGSDAVLLIVRVLRDGLLAEMVAAAAELELETLLEIHDGADLARALELPAPLLGINARDLSTFKVDLGHAAELASRVPLDRVVVLESGISGSADVRGCVARGLRQFLVGEHLLRAAEPDRALRELVGVG
jgi:indole-3-glycerol phosphate synthase